MDQHLLPTTAEHVSYVIEHMSQADRQEVFSIYGSAPDFILGTSWASGEPTSTMFYRDQVVGLVGLSAGDGSNDRRVWMLTTGALVHCQYLFLRRARAWLDQQVKFYTLWNYTSADHTTNLRWLPWMGFRFVGHRLSQHDNTILLKFQKDKT